jgi:hypothetical protein
MFKLIANIGQCSENPDDSCPDPDQDPTFLNVRIRILTLINIIFLFAAIGRTVMQSKVKYIQR